MEDTRMVRTSGSSEATAEIGLGRMPDYQHPAARLLHDLLRHRMALVGAIVTLLLMALGLLAPWLATHDYARQNLLEAFKPPLAPGHLLGTDQIGRDIWSRLVYGLRTSLLVGFGVTLIALLAGTVIGTLAGYLGGWADTVLSGAVEIIWGFPLILLAVILTGAMGPGLSAVVIAVGVINSAGFARIIRGEVLALRYREFVQAARAVGATDAVVIIRHILPNAMAPTLVMGSYYVALAIIAEAGLSFIGLGAQPPLPSLGTMIADGRNYLLYDHWISTIPGVTIVLLVLGLNLLGDGLRDILDPRLRER
jgi:peptide/nickel transport system permease protein